jgi:DNA-binding transcriptional regulator YhcF (GntR family)
MEFVLEKHSALPAHAQIKEQIKLALLLGRLRPGDTLPSIRDVEQEGGIGRNIVRRAYLELQEAGILSLRHGKGVLVEKGLSYAHRSSINEKCETMSAELMSKLKKAGISPPAFARYLYQQARKAESEAPFMVYVDSAKWVAEERAGQISSVWQFTVPARSTEELAVMDRISLRRIRKALTNYLRLDEVTRSVKGSGVEVIPLGLSFRDETIREFGKFPQGASVVLVVHETDLQALTLILELYRRILLEPRVRITAIPLSRIRDIHEFVNSSKYHKVIFSNRLWTEIPPDLKKHPRVTHPFMSVDLASLENARIQAGVII